jgi:hypothetical protein
MYIHKQAMSGLCFGSNLQGYLEAAAPVLFKGMLSRNLHSVLNTVSYLHNCIGGKALAVAVMEDGNHNALVVELIHGLLYVAENSKVRCIVAVSSNAYIR